MRCLCKTITTLFCSIIIALPLSCESPQSDFWGLPQHEYEYHAPEQLDDGLQTSSLADARVDPKKINELMDKILAEDLPNVHSVLLFKNGKLILEEYFYGYHRDKLHSIQSCTKSITSILVGIGVDQKIIPNLDTKVYELLSEHKGTEWIDQKYEITIEHALTMTAGLNWDESSYPRSDSRNDNTAMNRSANWIDYILNKKVVDTPGKKFNYTSGLTILLGEIIRGSSGLHADGFAEKHLFEPLGISDYKWYKNSVYGTIHTGGGLSLRPRDLVKIGCMVLKGGKWNGRQIVSINWINESTQAHINAEGHDYGYQWWRGKTVKKNQIYEAFWAAGAGGQYMFLLPELDLIAVFTSKHKDNPGGGRRVFSMLTNYILPAVTAPIAPRKNIKLNKMDLDVFLGTYQLKENDETITVTIFREGDRLFARRENEKEKVELFPETNALFFGSTEDIGDFLINFEKDDKGEISRFLLQFDRRLIFVEAPFTKIK
jgi:CubicO group peptidase (beta-lactamase class C family)